MNIFLSTQWSWRCGYPTETKIVNHVNELGGALISLCCQAFTDQTKGKSPAETYPTPEIIQEPDSLLGDLSPKATEERLKTTLYLYKKLPKKFLKNIITPLKALGITSISDENAWILREAMKNLYWYQKIVFWYNSREELCDQMVNLFIKDVARALKKAN